MMISFLRKCVSMNNDLIVSIITATYNRFDKLFDTIKSVYDQDYPYIEYIISDDGSKNFPIKELEEWKDKFENKGIKFRLIINDANVGTVRNLNGAYKCSVGSYIFNLSCGDVFYSNDVITRIVNRFIETKSDVLVTSRLLYKDDFIPVALLPHYDERRIIESKNTCLKQYKAFITSRFYDMASGSAMYLSRNILEKQGYYDEHYKLWEDGPFIAKYLRENMLEFAYDIISIWYEDGGVSSDRLDDLNVNGIDKPSSKYYLKLDMLNFIKNEKYIDISKFNLFERRMVKYRDKRFMQTSKKEKYLNYFLFFPEMLYFILYSYRRKKRIKRDIIFIESLKEAQL